MSDERQAFEQLYAIPSEAEWWQQVNREYLEQRKRELKQESAA
jgi:hypothetical protein